MSVTSETRVKKEPRKQRRGRETVFDMFRTLGIIGILVAMLWFFGQASPSDSKRIRPVDPTEAFQAFQHDDHGPVPSSQPSGWVINNQESEDGVVRVGYVIAKHYLEFQGSVGTAWLASATDKGEQTGTVDIAGVTWQKWEDRDGHTSLVKSFGNATVLVGGSREHASEAQLEELAATIH